MAKKYYRPLEVENMDYKTARAEYRRLRAVAIKRIKTFERHGIQVGDYTTSYFRGVTSLDKQEVYEALLEVSSFLKNPNNTYTRYAQSMRNTMNTFNNIMNGRPIDYEVTSDDKDYKRLVTSKNYYEVRDFIDWAMARSRGSRKNSYDSNRVMDLVKLAIEKNISLSSIKRSYYDKAQVLRSNFNWYMSHLDELQDFDNPTGKKVDVRTLGAYIRGLQRQ